MIIWPESAYSFSFKEDDHTRKLRGVLYRSPGANWRRYVLYRTPNESVHMKPYLRCTYLFADKPLKIRRTCMAIDKKKNYILYCQITTERWAIFQHPELLQSILPPACCWERIARHRIATMKEQDTLYICVIVEYFDDDYMIWYSLSCPPGYQSA